MPPPWDALRRAIFAELRKQRELGRAKARTSRVKVFGSFVQDCLARQGMSHREFATALDMDQELADAILQGILPEVAITSELLAEIGKIMGYEPEVLKALFQDNADSGDPGHRGDGPAPIGSA